MVVTKIRKKRERKGKRSDMAGTKTVLDGRNSTSIYSTVG